MRRWTFALLVLGIGAISAQGATVGLRWQDMPTSQKHDGSGTVEVYLELVEGDIVSGANTDFICIYANCGDLLIDNVAAGDAPGWAADRLGLGPHIGPPEFVGLTAFAMNPLADSLIGPPDGSTYVLATFDVSFTGPADGSQAGFGVNYPNNPAGGVINNVAAPLGWDERYNTSYSGYIAYGDYGYAGWYSCFTCMSPHGQIYDSPLIFTKVVPEPSNLAIVVCGGFVLLRRRGVGATAIGR